MSNQELLQNTTQAEDLLQNANQIMDDAVDKAGELLMTKPQIAEIILRQCLRCDPEHNTALQLLGLCKHRLGQNAEAIEIIQTVLDIDPDNGDNWNNLGLSYAGIGNEKKAIECIKKALELKPNNFPFLNNLALQYRAIGDYDNAIKSLRTALAIEERPQLWVNLGGMYGELHNLDEAEKCFESSIRLDPEYSAAYVDLAIVYHLKGNWKRGFAANEWRFFYFPQMKYYHNSFDMEKLWDGKADLNGKRVLIYGEQGLGDIMQFIRFAKYLKAKGAYVIVHCPASLDAIIRRVEGVDETTNRDIYNPTEEKFPSYDYQFAIMSFPYLLDVDKITSEPYIKPATTGFKDYMKSEYGDTLNVGIVWAGSASHPHDKTRSIPLKYFRSLHDTPGVKLFSLQMASSKRQYGVTYREVEDVTKDKSASTSKFISQHGLVDYSEECDDMKIVDLTTMVQSFDDTATILAGLDLVICCDTAVAHLAGAMGVPVWVAIPYNPDWRWLLNGETTDWYDSMKLYRQPSKGDWASVFERMQKDLNEVVLQNQR